MFIYSLKLFGSNWVKSLKFFLYYIVIWGLCFALLLPSIFAFKDLIVTNFKSNEVLSAFAGVFQMQLGLGLSTLVTTAYATLIDAFALNVGLAVYGLIVIFVILPFLINVGKYTFCEMLYSYMTSKNKVGFFSAFFKGLKNSLLFALCKVGYNLIFLCAVFASVFGMGMIENTFFITYLLPVVEFVILTLLFALHQISVLGWMSAIIVFDCNVFEGYRKGFKAVVRHFGKTFTASLVCFAFFWLLVLIFGVYSMAVLVPFMTTLLCVYDMAIFFSSQGMRFYYNENSILTPKKLEEVDSINKTAYLL